MFRTNHVTADPHANGPGKAGYSGGSLADQVPATVITAGAMNALQEEIANVVEFWGSLDASTVTQLLGAIKMTAMAQSDAAALSLLAETYSGPTNASGAAEFLDDANNVLCIVRPHVGGQIITSPDGGATWTPNPLTGGTTTNALRGVAAKANGASGSRFVAVGDSGRLQCFDTSASQTKATPAGGYSGAFNAVCFHNNPSSPKWVAVSRSDASGVQLATPGSETGTWTAGGATPGFSSDLWSCTSNGTAILAGGSGGLITRSLDHGATWSQVSTTFGSSIVQLEFVHGSFMALDSASRVFRSTDNGTTWSLLTGTLGSNASLSSKTGAVLVSRSGGGWTYFRRGDDASSGTPVIPAGVTAAGNQAWRLKSRWLLYCQAGVKFYLTPCLPY